MYLSGSSLSMSEAQGLIPSIPYPKTQFILPHIDECFRELK